MNNRFMFRLPFYNNKGEFSHFEFILIGESLPAYNAGVMHHNNEYEQCTGLKDKNGNLIYEGDIVKYWWNQKTNTGTIFWNNEFARFCIANNETHCPEDSSCLMFVADKKIIEIIGNIHKQAEQKDK